MKYNTMNKELSQYGYICSYFEWQIYAMNRKALIVQVSLDNNGNVTNVMLDNGKVHSINEALLLSKSGLIENIITKQTENGIQYFRDNPTPLGDDLFNNLPKFDLIKEQ